MYCVEQDYVENKAGSLGMFLGDERSKEAIK
jgi:hypothetical protein